MTDQTYIAPAALARLRTARSLRQNVYIYGATGYGKTELVKQYLANRRYCYISCAEGDRGFQAVREMLEDQREKDVRRVVVIDDLYLLKDEERQKEIVELSEREKLWLILISRGRMPSWLALAYTRAGFMVIEEEQLRLKEPEVRRLFAGYHLELEPEQIRQVTENSDGNACVLGLAARLMADGLQQGEELYESASRLFGDYLENVVFAQWDAELLEFLMQISVVDEFTAPLAEMITGNVYVARMIQTAVTTGNFLSEDDGIYRLRPEFLQILRKRAELVCGSERVREYAYNAGLYYEMNDRIPEALEMYEKSGRDGRVRELLIRNARRNPGNGHYYELRRYYLQLGEEEVEQSAVLMAGMSMLYSLLMQPEQSEYWYDRLKAYERTAKGGEKREAGGRLAYLDIALPHRGSKGMLHIMKQIPAMVFDKGIALPEFSVTSNLPSTMNGGKDFCHWSRYDRELAASIGKLVEHVLGRYGKGIVGAALGESLYEKGADTYEVLALLSRAEMEAESGGALEIAFAAAGIRIRLYLLNGDIETAKMQLDSFEERAKEEKATQLLANIEALRCRLALYEGDGVRISRWMELAPDENQEFYILDRYRYLTKVRCYLAADENLNALALLEKIRYYAESYQRTYIRMEVGILSSVAIYRQGGNWKSGLKETLREASGYRFLRLFSEEGAAIYEMLRQIRKECLEDEAIDTAWFERLFQETGNVVVRYPVYLKRNLSAALDFSENAIAILRLQAEGLSVNKIAQRLGMKPETVRYHTKENYRKLGVSGKADAVLAARNLNLL